MMSARKSSLYAKIGIPDYWTLSLIDDKLEVRRLPIVDASEKYGFAYSQINVLGPQDFASPLEVPDVRIAVSDLLP
jgi:Uma2 family endonuclease